MRLEARREGRGASSATPRAPPRCGSTCFFDLGACYRVADPGSVVPTMADALRLNATLCEELELNPCLQHLAFSLRGEAQVRAERFGWPHCQGECREL